MMNCFWTAQVIIFPQGQKTQNKTIHLLHQRLDFILCCVLLAVPNSPSPISNLLLAKPLTMKAETFMIALQKINQHMAHHWRLNSYTKYSK